MKLAAILLTLSLPALAGDWPQWRGANRDDNSTETGLLKQWPAEGPKRAWLFEKAGMGYAGFSVVAGQLFTLGTRDGKEILLAIDEKTGNELWATPIGDLYTEQRGDGPRSTPTVDADRVYAMSGRGNLTCAQAKDGKILWEKSMQDLGGSVPHWGFTESPLVDGNLVLCTPGGDKGTMAALDKMTGAPVWQSAEITEGAQYSSIIPATISGKKQYVQFVMQTLFGVDAATGKLIWRSPWSAGRTAIIPTPIVKGDEVFISSGYGAGCKKVKVKGSEATDVFMNKDLENHHGGVILVGDYLYGHSKGGWTCMSFADGSVKWTDKGVGKGAITYADGMFYCVGEKSGEVALIEASPSGWNEKGRFKLAPQSPDRSPQGAVWVHPVIANGKLYLRDQNYIYCYDVKTPTP